MVTEPERRETDSTTAPLVLDIESSAERLTVLGMLLSGSGAAIWIGGAVSGNADIMPGWPHALGVWLGLFFVSAFIRGCLNDRYVLDPGRQVLEWHTQRFVRQREWIASFSDIVGVCIMRSYNWDNDDSNTIDAALYIYLRGRGFVRVSSWMLSDFSTQRSLSFETLDRLAVQVADLIDCPYWDRDLKHVLACQTVGEAWKACQEAPRNTGYPVPESAFWEWAMKNRGLNPDGDGSVTFSELRDVAVLFMAPGMVSLSLLGVTFFGYGTMVTLARIGMAATLFSFCVAGFVCWLIFLDRFLVPVLPIRTRFDLQRGLISQGSSIFGYELNQRSQPLGRGLALDLRQGWKHKGTRQWHMVLVPEKPDWIPFTVFHCRHDDQVAPRKKVDHLAFLLGVSAIARETNYPETNLPSSTSL
ncbi:MAG TPA: hypothetical protein PKO06_17735, partial [Candidatus Ozemobacteraceae bacterium]|nr:hypothetical protein [Candidatus Ozemobacteraceae bacterium]